MKKIIKPIIKQFVCLALVGLLVGQGSGYLAQKLMVENNIRERVRDALSKIVDNNKYVINVDVDLEISDQVEEQITVLAGRDKSIKVEAKSDDASSIKEDLSSITQSIDIEEETEKSSYSGGLPIPGFEMDFTKSNKKVKNIEKPEPPVISSDTKKPIVVTDLGVESNNQPRVDKVLSRTRPSRAEIKKMYISLILQEGAAPELIENIRQLTMAAAKFDRNRGDKLTIMTASFREKRDQRSAEQIMLKNIAEKIEILEQKREIEENTQDKTWKDELTRYRDEESSRREEDRKFFEGQISQLEQQAKERAYEQEKKDMLLRDSLKLKKLNDEIIALKSMLKSSGRRDSLRTISKQERLDSLRYENLSGELDELAKSLQVAVTSQSKEDENKAKKKIQEEMAEREIQKQERETEIASKIKELDNVQAELDRLHEDMEKESGNTFIFLVVLGALVFLLIVALIFVMLRNNNRQQAPIPPWMMPPPPRRPRPRRKESKSEKTSKESAQEKIEEPASKADTQPEPVVAPATSQAEQPPSSEEELKKQDESSLPSSDDDPNVVRSEINDIRKSVVSMSVGQPDRTTTIVKEWLEQPEPAPPAEEESNDSNDSGDESKEADEKEK